MKRETLAALQAIQKEIALNETADRQSREQDQELYVEKKTKYSELLQSSIQTTPAYSQLRQFLDSDLLICELHGIWELLHRKAVEKRANQSGLRRIFPDKSVIANEVANQYIQAESLLPDLELFISQESRGSYDDSELDTIVKKKCDTYWQQFLYGRSANDKQTSKDLGKLSLTIPGRTEVSIVITCSGRFKNVSLGALSFTVQSSGLGLDGLTVESQNEMITYLATYLMKNGVLFTASDTDRRD